MPPAKEQKARIDLYLSFEKKEFFRRWAQLTNPNMPANRVMSAAFEGLVDRLRAEGSTDIITQYSIQSIPRDFLEGKLTEAEALSRLQEIKRSWVASTTSTGRDSEERRLERELENVENSIEKLESEKNNDARWLGWFLSHQAGDPDPDTPAGPYASLSLDFRAIRLKALEDVKKGPPTWLEEARLSKLSRFEIDASIREACRVALELLPLRQLRDQIKVQLGLLYAQTAQSEL